MKPDWVVVPLMYVVGCGAINEANGSLESRPTPSPGAKPAVKKELPTLTVPGGQLKTTLFYGPWQCRREFMSGCRRECAIEGHTLKGCMWLSDFKFDWEGRIIALPVPVKAGSRYGLYHCCCDYAELSKPETRAARKKWEGRRESFRRSWSEKFGRWPEKDGVAWPGHHIRDLKHGGDALDPNNVIPVEPDVHGVLNEQYPACYAGSSPWNTAGPDLPYTDN